MLLQKNGRGTIWVIAFIAGDLKTRKIGIIGGMGPEATSVFYSEIIRIFQRDFGAVYDRDYPEIIMISLPLPDVVVGNGDEPVIVPMLMDAAERLEAAGADFIAIPCNTVYRYIGYIRNAVSIKVLDIVHETAKRIRASSIRKVGLLATEGTLESGIYDKCLGNQGITLIVPKYDMQCRITGIIMNILSGNKLDEDREALFKIIEYLGDEGAEAIVLGCTDLPLLISESPGRVRIFNSLKILSESVVENATGRKLIKDK